MEAQEERNNCPVRAVWLGQGRGVALILILDSRSHASHRTRAPQEAGDPEPEDFRQHRAFPASGASSRDFGGQFHVPSRLSSSSCVNEAQFL